LIRIMSLRLIQQSQDKTRQEESTHSRSL